jgi:hypothetical protein
MLAILNIAVPSNRIANGTWEIANNHKAPFIRLAVLYL